jgi:membrane-associated protein
VDAPRSSLDVPALAVVLVLGVFHHHLHGPSFDYLGVALAAAISWVGVPGIGEPVLIAGGIYAARGTVDLAELLVIAWMAATVGGTIGWLLGVWGGRTLWTAPGPLQRLRISTLTRGERFFERYGILAVYLAPSWVAGINGMRSDRFLPANAVCAALWTLLVGGGAYLVGPAITDVVADLGLAGGIVLGVLVLVGVVFERSRRRRGRRRR